MKLLLIMLIALITLTACTSSSTGRKQVMLFSDAELDKMGAA
jgi:putative cell wall-binding protein